MIFIQRTKGPPSLDLNDPDSAGSKELAAFIKNMVEEGTLPGEDDFKAYTAADVREALGRLFHGKCAYCETTIVGASQSDIEHYRPKGGVTEAKQLGIAHPGYWWLAMAWDNLLLSCMHCNQSRRQLILNDDMSVDEIQKAIEADNRQTTGKKNFFPTATNVWTTEHTGNVDDEEPLLIDPTRTDPQPLLEWRLDGELPAVRPRDGCPRATATIEILGLKRRHLSEHRKKTLLLLRRQANEVRKHVDRIATATDDASANMHRNDALDALEMLAEFTTDDKDFAGMARTVLDEMKSIVASAL